MADGGWRFPANHEQHAPLRGPSVSSLACFVFAEDLSALSRIFETVNRVTDCENKQRDK